MVDFLKRSWAVVNMDQIDHNVEQLRSILRPGCMVMGVVKADAYGHGDKHIAEELTHLGVNWFGVSNLNEALALREQGIFQPILIFGATPVEHVRTLNRYHITQTVYCLDYAQRLHAAACAENVNLNIHIKVDTGMSRLGFVATGGLQQQTVEEIETVAQLPNFRAEGIFTHFASADECEEDGTQYTETQFAHFMQVLELLEQRDVRFAIRHCCNSAATIRFPHMHLDMVRPGILLYGLNPSKDCAGLLDLRPAMELFSAVSMVKEIPEGIPVSYGRIYKAHRPTRIATVGIGYADGYERELSNKSRMLVRGQFANVVGRVCMDQLMIDVTHIEGVCAGDVVTIVGTDGTNSLSFDEMAALSGTVNYEKVCLLGRRVPRVYRKNGKDVGILDYLHPTRD